MNTGHKWMIWLVRLIFTALLLFEILNLAGLLHWQITYSWLLLVMTAAFVWFLIELLWRELASIGALEKGWLLFFAMASVLVDFFGNVARFYSLVIYNQFIYDKFAHFLGGLAVAIGVTILFRTKKIIPAVELPPHLSFKMQLLLIISLTALLGILYEFGEYVDTRYFGHNTLGDGFDTVDDLLFNIAGAATGGLISLKNLHLSLFGKLKKIFKRGA